VSGKKTLILFTLALSAVLAIGVVIGRRSVATPSSQTAQAEAPAQPRPSQRLSSARVLLPVESARNPSRTTAVSLGPLPAPGAPLKLTLADLVARAYVGDAQAASRLFSDLQRCSQVASINRQVPIAAMRYLNAKPEKVSEESAKSMNTMLTMMSDELKYARDNATLCAGLDDVDLMNTTPAALQAALLGDDVAASCYLGSNLTRQPGVLDHLEWLVAFKDNALPLADASVERGNWTAVKQLAFAYKGVFRDDLLSQVTGSDATQAYRYLKLWRLGAKPGDTSYLDNELEQAIKQLTSDAVTAADAWANDTYQHSFAANPHTDQRGSITICQRDAP